MTDTPSAEVLADKLERMQADNAALLSSYSCIDEAIALLRTLAQPARDGWKLVPVEPTKEMIAAGVQELHRTVFFYSDIVANVYKTMLAAAPSPGGKP